MEMIGISAEESIGIGLDVSMHVFGERIRHAWR